MRPCSSSRAASRGSGPGCCMILSLVLPDRRRKPNGPTTIYSRGAPQATGAPLPPERSLASKKPTLRRPEPATGSMCMTNRRILITWVGGPFDGKQECCAPAETGPAERQALAVQDGVGKITSIAWYRLNPGSVGGAGGGLGVYQRRDRRQHVGRRHAPGRMAPDSGSHGHKAARCPLSGKRSFGRVPC